MQFLRKTATEEEGNGDAKNASQDGGPLFAHMGNHTRLLARFIPRLEVPAVLDGAKSLRSPLIKGAI